MPKFHDVLVSPVCRHIRVDRHIDRIRGAFRPFVENKSSRVKASMEEAMCSEASNRLATTPPRESVDL